MEIISRPLYLNHIISRLNRGMMLILVGQRRVGKSFVLRELKNWLQENRPNSNLVYINKELLDYGDITTARELYDYAIPRLPKGEENYLLIDEVQDIKEYERHDHHYNGRQERGPGIHQSVPAAVQEDRIQHQGYRRIHRDNGIVLIKTQRDEEYRYRDGNVVCSDLFH